MVVLFTSEIYFTRNITSAKKTRALEASGYLGGFSESAPHMGIMTAHWAQARSENSLWRALSFQACSRHPQSEAGYPFDAHASALAL